MKISVSTDISVFGFYGYIGDISVDIFTKISIYRKLNCCDQFITVRSNQDFKSGHLNISPIYPRYIPIYLRYIPIRRYISDILPKN